MLELHTITAIIVNLTMLTLVVGFLRALLVGTKTVVHLSASIILILVAYTMRADYWDLQLLFGDDTFAYGGLKANVVFNLLAVWGALHGHIALHRMIPEEDRNNWSILCAWAYPPFNVLKRFRKRRKK